MFGCPPPLHTPRPWARYAFSSELPEPPPGAVTDIMAADAGAPRFTLLYLSASVTDLRMGYRSYLELEEGYTLCADGMRYVSDVFVRDELDRFDWRASPILAPSLRGLPRTMIVNGEWDVLRDESRAFGDRLRDAGVEVSVTLIPEEGHAYSPDAAPGVQKLFYQFVRDMIGTAQGQVVS